MPLRGIRGATTVENDTSEEILLETRRLLQLIQRKNEIQLADIASVLFTVTPDLKSTFPAEAARQLKWEAALICAHEIPVADSLPMCIRVLLHWNTDVPSSQVQHVYLNHATNLRDSLPELSRQELDDLEDWVQDQLSDS